MSNDERKARSLQRWLEAPAGTAPPDDVDRDAIEAVYALRPDLAPRPRVSADDILALVTKGPLAGTPAAPTPEGAERAGEVVPFPARRQPPSAEAEEPAPAPVPVRRGRLFAFVGGTGGLGLALVAAATLLLVAVPALQDHAAPTAADEASPGVAMSRPSASTPAPAPAAATPEAPPPPPPPPAQVATRSAPASSAAQAPAGLAGGAVAKEMADGRVRSVAQDGIPELREAAPAADAPPELPTADAAGSALAKAEAQAPAEPQAADGDAVASADDAELEGAAPVAAAPAAAPSEEADLGSLRERAAPREDASWRAGVDADTLARIDQAIEKANALRRRGDLRAAADKLASVVQPPPRAGQHVAALAARDYLDAGDPRAAATIAQKGLSLSSADTPERSALLALYGDAQQAQAQPARARDAYEQADDANVDR